MNKRYFKLLAANKADAELLIELLNSRTFYPNANSTPALLATYDNTFDYRQFFIVIGLDFDGGVIVFTRSEYTAITFGTSVIPTAHWTERYRLSEAPTVEELPEYTEIINGVNKKNTSHIFLSYDYNLSNNF